MITPIPLLQNVRVASPCDAKWDGMNAVDGERVRFCDSCQKNVYNLSAMSQSEAEGLLRKHEGRLCIRYYRRQDGTILTGDCPIGAQMVRMNLIRRSLVAASLFTLLFSAIGLMRDSSHPLMGAMPISVPHEEPAIMGGMPAPVIHEPQPIMGTSKAPSTVDPATELEEIRASQPEMGKVALPSVDLPSVEMGRVSTWTTGARAVTTPVPNKRTPHKKHSGT